MDHIKGCWPLERSWRVSVGHCRDLEAARADRVRKKQKVLAIGPLYARVVPNASAQNVQRLVSGGGKQVRPVGRPAFVDMALPALPRYCRAEQDDVGNSTQISDER